MNKYLYFAKAAADGTAGDEEVLMLPAANISHFEMDTATRLNIFAKTGVGQEAQADGVDHVVCGIDITSGKHKEAMQDIAKAIYENQTGAMATIADSENSVFCSGAITACASISVVDAS